MMHQDKLQVTETPAVSTDAPAPKTGSPKLNVGRLQIPSTQESSIETQSPLTSKSLESEPGKKLKKSPTAAAKTPKSKLLSADNKSTDMGLLFAEDSEINVKGMERHIQSLGYVFEKKLYKPALRTVTNTENILISLLQYIQFKKKVQNGETLNATEAEKYRNIAEEFKNLRIHLMDNQLSGAIGDTAPVLSYTHLRGVTFSGLLQGILGENAELLSTLCLKAGLSDYTSDKIKALQATMKQKLATALEEGLGIKENTDLLIDEICAAIRELGIPNAMPIITSDKNGWNLEPELTTLSKIIEKVYGGFNVEGTGKAGSFPPKLFAEKINEHAKRPQSRLKDWSASVMTRANSNVMNRLGTYPFGKTPKTGQDFLSPSFPVTPASTRDEKSVSFPSTPSSLSRETSTDLTSPFAPGIVVDAKEEETPSPISVTTSDSAKVVETPTAKSPSSTGSDSPKEEARVSQYGFYKKARIETSPTGELEKGISNQLTFGTSSTT